LETQERANGMDDGENGVPSGTVRTPDEALAELMAGNRRYVESTIFNHDFSVARASAPDVHSPIAGILSCSDARVASEIIFDRGPGDLFMVRVAGNYLSEYGLASLEYCVEYSNTPLLMVLGHTQCGAVTAALKVVKEKTRLPGSLPFLIGAIEASVHSAEDSHPEDLLYASIVENVRRNVSRLQTISPIINEAQAQGRVKVVGGVYDLSDGKVTLV